MRLSPAFLALSLALTSFVVAHPVRRAEPPESHALELGERDRDVEGLHWLSRRTPEDPRKVVNPRTGKTKGAETQALLREKWRKDPVKYQAILAKDRERKQQERARNKAQSAANNISTQQPPQNAMQMQMQHMTGSNRSGPSQLVSAPDLHRGNQAGGGQAPAQQPTLPPIRQVFRNELALPIPPNPSMASAGHGRGANSNPNTAPSLPGIREVFPAYDTTRPLGAQAPNQRGHPLNSYGAVGGSPARGSNPYAG
ncbi:hypothetical protein K474DRAFT_1661939 [Panus rudis PR-1116 ss-1]|nr:hypothetical protein K474DRAFT_1661939 [Panus rudis PR-1116 ss-1]